MKKLAQFFFVLLCFSVDCLHAQETNQLPAIADAALQAIDEIEFFSLFPYQVMSDLRYRRFTNLSNHALGDSIPVGSNDVAYLFPPTNVTEMLYGYLILGEVAFKRESDNAKMLVKSFKAGIEGSDGRAAGCFSPRHGIRAKHGDQVHEFLVCFECSWTKHFINGKRQDNILTSGEPEAVFNRLLKEEGVPLPPEPPWRNFGRE